MPEDMPDRMPDRMPEDMSEYMPEDMPDRMPDRMPEDMSDRMPEDMPDRMPEDMSDRMPQDLPVRKCINVMVGITRSKVIFKWAVIPKALGASADQSLKKFGPSPMLLLLYPCTLPIYYLQGQAAGRQKTVTLSDRWHFATGGISRLNT